MRYAIAGKGRSGQAASLLLASHGHQVEFLDDADKTLTPEKIESFDAVVLSPGIPRAHPAIQAALSKSIPIYNEIEIAAAELANCRFVGITGTNGKSTTTALLGHIVQCFEPETFIGGNLGRPLCEAVAAGERPKYAILELSSFQLETISRLNLEVAILLNLSPDHLDRYPSLEAYYETKRGIFKLGSPIKIPPDLPFSKGGEFTLPGNLLGQHNVQNARAAICAAQALKIPDSVIQPGLDSFPGIAHRLEILGVKNGVTWINDSKATNVESTLAALSCFKSGVHLILGGHGKGASYEPLVKASLGCVKRVYVIGEDALIIKEAYGGNVIEAQTLENAATQAYRAAVSSDTVLLSPACASYDQFKNFEHRGDVFRELFLGF